MKKIINRLNEMLETVTIQASSLSFYTIFSIVPIMLIVLSVFSSTPMFTEYYQKIETFLVSNLLPTNQGVIKGYLNNFLKNSSSMGIMGMFFIFVTSILFFNNFETIVHKIFSSPKRDVWQRVMLYWTMMTLFPLLFSFSIYLSIKIQNILNMTSYTNAIDFLAIFPFLMSWALFFLAYKLTPFKKLNNKAVITTSLLINAVFSVSKSLFVYYIVFNKSYDSLYGPFSVVLFIFLWIYVSWIIFLSGAYLCSYVDEFLSADKNRKLRDIFKYIKENELEEKKG